MDELLGRRIPHSPIAEQAVIGSMLIDPACVPIVLELLKPDDLYISVNRDIYETIYNMFSYGITIDPVTVLNQMKIRGVFTDESIAYIADVMRVTPASSNVKEYVAIIRDKALLRRLGTAASEITDLVYGGEGTAESILDVSEQKIFALRSGRNVGGLIHVKDVVLNVYDMLEKYAQIGSTIPGLSTGLDALDQKILGLNKSELIIIAARPGMGKTSMALNMALNVGLNLKKTVAVFSLEMSREQLVTRFISSLSRISGKKLNTGNLKGAEWDSVFAASTQISSSNILVDDNPTLTVSEMNAQCRRVKDLSLVVIDYLQLMQSAGTGHSWSNESRTQAVSDISRMLKIMAKELKVPVICLSQLSRANEARKDKRPMLSDLRESGSIEQDADVVIGLYREDYYSNNEEGGGDMVVPENTEAEAIVLKNRKGETGPVKLMWNAATTTFKNVI